MAFPLRSLFLLTFCAATLLRTQTQFQNGTRHTGVYPDATVLNGPELIWKYQTGGAVRSTPAVSGTSVVFGSSDGMVYCLSASGTRRWSFAADGAVSSSAAISGGKVFFTSRANTLFALDLAAGTLVWKRSLGEPLPYEWGFDYYLSSPAIDGTNLYIGSADGRIIALDTRNGNERWSYHTGARVRSTPAVDEARVYAGDCAGTVHALDKTTGAVRWQFATIGDTLDNERYGFDRNAVISSATIDGERLFVGGRDGYLYALQRSTGTLLWKFDYAVSWVISTAAVKNGLLVTGTSDGRFVHAVESATGRERWRFMTQATVWASPALSGNDVVVIPSNDGYVYALDLATGTERWRFKTGPQMFSSVVPVKDRLYFGSDDGALYALKTATAAPSRIAGTKRGVFWMKNPPFQSFRSGMDVAIRDHFIREGYEFYDETDVRSYLTARIASDTPSVLVCATNYFLPSLTKDSAGTNLLRRYLERGGSIAVLGLNPAAYEMDSSGTQVVGLNFHNAKKITGIPYRYKDLRSHGGFYSSSITPEGKRRGLMTPFVAVAGIPVGDISVPLAVDENGNATAWLQSFSARRTAGYLQFSLTPERLHALPEIQHVIESFLGE